MLNNDDEEDYRNWLILSMFYDDDQFRTLGTWINELNIASKALVQRNGLIFVYIKEEPMYSLALLKFNFVKPYNGFRDFDQHGPVS